MSGPEESIRTYGNWRRPDSRGLGGLGTLGTGIMVGGLGLVIVWMMARGFVEGLIVALVIGAFLGLILARDKHHKTLLTRIKERMVWWDVRRSGHQLYRSGPLARVGLGTHQLPGVLSVTELSECIDAHGRRFALLGLAKHRFSVVIATSPDGAALVDESQIDQWVARFGGWLMRLGDEPGLVAAQITVESAPDSGAELRRRVLARIDPNAPAFAKQVMQDVVDEYPTASHSTRAWVALTFSSDLSADEFGREIATRLPALTAGLTEAGAGATKVCDGDELCRIVRVAFDPESARTFDEATMSGEVPELTWQEVGPSAHETTWDSYLHDSGLSTTWEMTEAPRGPVPAQILAQLLKPHRDIQRKRVSLMFRPTPIGQAAALVEKDLDAAQFRRDSATTPTARMRLAVKRAEKTADEEAAGAGLVNFGMLVTATVAKDVSLRKAKDAMDGLKATARLQLRPCYGAQDSAFAASLPLGIVLGDLLTLPTEVTNKL